MLAAWTSKVDNVEVRHDRPSSSASENVHRRSNFATHSTLSSTQRRPRATGGLRLSNMFVVTVASTSRSIAPALRSAKSARAVRLPLPPLLAPIQQRAFSASIRPLADATSKLALPPSIKDAEAYSRWYGKLSKDDQQAHMRWRRDFQKQQAEQELPVICEQPSNGGSTGLIAGSAGPKDAHTSYLGAEGVRVSAVLPES